MEQRFFPWGDYPEIDLGNRLSRRLLSFGDGLMLTEMDFEAGVASNRHAHPEEQLTYCQSGLFEARVGGETSLLRPGDSFVAGPLVEHGVVCREAGKLLHVFTPPREDYKEAPKAAT